MDRFKKIIVILLASILAISGILAGFSKNALAASNTYIYNMLKTDGERQFFNNFESICDEIDNSSDYISSISVRYNTGVSRIKNGASRIMELTSLFLNDHPQYFWLDCVFNYKAKKENGSTVYDISVGVLNEFRDGTARQNAKSRINSVAAGYSVSGSEYNKVKFIYDKLYDNLSYDNNAGPTDDQTISSALLNGVTVCAGYSQSFSYLCRRNGINAFSVLSNNHEWNMVEIDGYWYCVDITHDDTSRHKYRYFLKSYNNFQEGEQDERHAITKEHYPTYLGSFPSCQSNYNGAVAPSSSNSNGSGFNVEDVVKEYPNTGILGDANGDGSIDSKDATLILIDYAYKISGHLEFLNNDTANVNRDSAIDAKDATIILKYYADSIAHGAGRYIEEFI